MGDLWGHGGCRAGCKQGGGAPYLIDMRSGTCSAVVYSSKVSDETLADRDGLQQVEPCLLFFCSQRSRNRSFRARHVCAGTAITRRSGLSCCWTLRNEGWEAGVRGNGRLCVCSAGHKQHLWSCSYAVLNGTTRQTENEFPFQSLSVFLFVMQTQAKTHHWSSSEVRGQGSGQGIWELSSGTGRYLCLVDRFTLGRWRNEWRSPNFIIPPQSHHPPPPPNSSAHRLQRGVWLRELLCIHNTVYSASYIRRAKDNLLPQLFSEKDPPALRGASPYMHLQKHEVHNSDPTPPEHCWGDYWKWCTVHVGKMHFTGVCTCTQTQLCWIPHFSDIVLKLMQNTGWTFSIQTILGSWVYLCKQHRGENDPHLTRLIE